MAGGLAALLDDVAALARLAAANADDIAAASARASAKAAGVVVDDAAVTPQYVRGLEPKRELPIIRKIAMGSLRNKLLIILPIAMLLSIFVPWLLIWILMLGASFLCFEGAEKIWEMLRGHKKDEPAAQQGPEAEKRVVSSAIRTDLILSAEIMVISLNEVADQPILNQALILIVVGIGLTILVYGAVGLLVKMDDIGLALMRRSSEASQRIGRGLVTAMPKVMQAISVIGMVAMLWVGGHIILVGTHDLGLDQPYGLVHGMAEAVHHVAGIGGVLAWLVETFFSMVLGAILGAIIFAIIHHLPIHRRAGQHPEDRGAGAHRAAKAGTA
ncbi:MAG: DUF808 domain-containing protein [Brachybacterium sp.]|nr:DUF808 domain-containing protein [Brachybacterium sp.]